MSTLDGRRLNDDEQDARSLQIRVVTPDYFRSMAIPIVRGRALTAADRAGAAPAVVVNETAAARIWPNENPLGHEFTLGTRLGQGEASAGGTVVGVARDVHDFGPAQAVRPTVYLAHAQFPMGFVTITVRTHGEPSALAEPLRSVLGELDPDVPMFRVRTMEQIAGDAVAQPRVYVLLLGMFAGTAVLLAALGIYGVLMHAVTQRTREIGIRLALGAGRGQVVRMVVWHASVLAGVGLAIGLALAFGASRLISGVALRGRARRHGDLCRGRCRASGRGASRQQPAGVEGLAHRSRSSPSLRITGPAVNVERGFAVEPRMLLQDLRYGLRLLIRRPAFALVAVTTLALGIGTNTAIFTFIDRVILRAIPFPDPEQLVVIWETNPRLPVPVMVASPPTLFEWMTRNRSFVEVGAFRWRNVTLGGGEPEQIRGASMTASLLRAVGVRPALGRLFVDDEDRPTARPVALIADALWRRRFGGNPGRASADRYRVVAMFNEPAGGRRWLRLAARLRQRR